MVELKRAQSLQGKPQEAVTEYRRATVAQQNQCGQSKRSTQAIAMQAMC